ncbi:hypothetical protein AVEN_38852-1 [Araneus ventricosus]|uniref:Uncharacterized protein n=1 Tax=Araneus ventricosus TaxID=182803 RepID=A0A4Y2U1F6_ARAVE|nr:hypothetical protein AVEN_38852-1 [Araneus ventricosus]
MVFRCLCAYRAASLFVSNCPGSKESLSKRFWKPCRQQGQRIVTKVSMTRVEPFGKVAERFASQQETRFSQSFITSLFQAIRKVKSPSSAEKIEPPSPFRSRTPTKAPHFFHPLFKAVLIQRGSNHLFYSPSSDVILVQLECQLSRLIRNLN